MFHVRHLASRFASRQLAAAVASTSAAGLLTYNAKFVACDEPTVFSKKASQNKKMEMGDDFELFHAYEVHFGHDAKQPISRNDLTEILLHVGILDPAISNFLFNSLVAMDKKKELRKSKRGRTAGSGKPAEAEVVEKPAEAEAAAEVTSSEETVTYGSFLKLCHTFYKGEDLAKWEIMFDFMDPDKSGMADKNEISIALRHLLWCQTNWYGEEILYDGPFDLDLYFDVPTEAIAQIKANKLAHEMVMASHGGGRQSAVTTKQFLHWMRTGGKQVEYLKGLFSVFGAYNAPTFNTDYDE